METHYKCLWGTFAVRLPILRLQLFDNMMSPFLFDEDVCGNYHSHKRRIKPSRGRCGRMCGTAPSVLLHCQSHLLWPCFHCGAPETCHNPTERTRKRIYNHFTVLSGPHLLQTKACVSMTTPRWDSLPAIDSSVSAECWGRNWWYGEIQFNLPLRLLALPPHVNGINGLRFELHHAEW